MMRVYHFTEQPYPDAWNDHGGSLRVNLPNRKCDPAIAADLYHRFYDEWLLADEFGFDFMLNEHHQTATCMSSTVVVGLSVLARQTKRARLLVLGYPIGHRPDPTGRLPVTPGHGRQHDPVRQGGAAATQRRARRPSRPAGRDVAIDLATVPDEDDPVAGRIAAIEFHLRVGHGNSRAVLDHAFAVGDDGHVVIAFGLELISLEGVGLAAAGNPRMVRLPQGLKPFTDLAGRTGPLAVVPRHSRRTEREHGEPEQDERNAQFHGGSPMKGIRFCRTA
jgi:hypothetical protein